MVGFMLYFLYSCAQWENTPTVENRVSQSVKSCLGLAWGLSEKRSVMYKCGAT